MFIWQAAWLMFCFLLKHWMHLISVLMKWLILKCQLFADFFQNCFSIHHCDKLRLWARMYKIWLNRSKLSKIQIHKRAQTWKRSDWLLIRHSSWSIDCWGEKKILLLANTLSWDLNTVLSEMNIRLAAWGFVNSWNNSSGDFASHISWCSVSLTH